MQDKLPNFDIVLLGVGHTNAHVLRMWRMNPIPDARLTCVSDFGVATYSGMLPGTLAGQYQPSEMQIDLVRLAAAAGARLVLGEVTGLDVDGQQLQFADRPSIRFDVLSIGVGSRPTIPANASQLGMAIKPMQTFLDRLDERIDQLIANNSDRPLRITIVGAGAAGVEIACCLPAQLTQRCPLVQLRIALVDRGDAILAGMPSRTRRLAHESLAHHRVDLLLEKEVVRTSSDGRIHFNDGSEGTSDLVIWATAASSPPLLGRLGLATDDRGFLLTRDTLQTVTSDNIFAVGDTATSLRHPHPKAGVYAVRQAPVLWKNLQRQLRAEPLETWAPQRSFLSLLNSGDGHAILTYKGLSFHGRWCWRLKDFIDRRFMAKYQDYTPMPMVPAPPQEDAEPMYCGGCGCKLPGDILSRVLQKLDNPAPPHVLVGLEQPDDVAVIRTGNTHAVAATVDFFSAFIDDPFLLGRIAALNALSDMFAKGAKPLGALALVTVPHGSARQQEDFLTQLLAGSLHEFRPIGVPLVGGHTTEASQSLAGFALLGEVDADQLATKSRLQSGDQLVLTKPLGTGILLAGHMRAMCECDWMASLIESMLMSNQALGDLAREMQTGAVTDVTGFGFASHLFEMLMASGASAEISLDALPLLPGTAELIGDGVESTLAPGNRAIQSKVVCEAALSSDPRYAALFDPQTSGGLLLGVPRSKLEAFLQRAGDSAVVVGHVIESTNNQPTIHVRDM